MPQFQITKLPQAELEFAGPGFYADPRRGLHEAGPFDLRFGPTHRSQVRLAFVGPRDIVHKTRQFLLRCLGPLAPPDAGRLVYPYPGFQEVFRSELITSDEAQIILGSEIVDRSLARKPYDGFGEIVTAYSDAILRAKRDFVPDLVICCIPHSVERRLGNVQRAMSELERRAAKAAADKVTSNQIELPFDWQPEETSEDLLRRDLRRALKAQAMRHGVPIQLMTEHGAVDSESNEGAASRAWNLTVALYYKAGGIPWRVRPRGPETCYVGVTFHHLRTNKRALVHTALAQAFSTNGGGYALRGNEVRPAAGDRSRTPHLSKDQAEALGVRVLDEYVSRNGSQPQRIVLHKSSRFWEAEEEGFSAAFKNVPLVQLASLSPSSIRLLTHATYPPTRGTLLSVNEARHFLFTSGYIRDLQTYPGPHIPVPVEIIVHGDHALGDVRQVASEALALGRLNWNTSDLRSSQPVTLAFARRVGGIMAEYGLLDDKEPDSNYRYYM